MSIKVNLYLGLFFMFASPLWIFSAVTTGEYYKLITFVLWFFLGALNYYVYTTRRNHNA